MVPYTDRARLLIPDTFHTISHLYLKSACFNKQVSLAPSVFNQGLLQGILTGGPDIFFGEITCHKYSLFSYFLVKYAYYHCELNYNSSNSQEIAGLPLHYLSGSVKMTFFNRYEDTVWPPQCHNFDSTAGAGGFTAGAAVPAVNMLEEALSSTELYSRKNASTTGLFHETMKVDYDTDNRRRKAIAVVQ